MNTSEGKTFVLKLNHDLKLWGKEKTLGAKKIFKPERSLYLLDHSRLLRLVPV